MAQQWYYTKSGEQHGPVSSAELKELARTGALRPKDLVWREGMDEWQKAGSVTGLLPKGMDTMPPPAPPPLPSASPVASKKFGSNKPLLLMGALSGGFLLMMFLCCGVLGFLGGDGVGSSGSVQDIVEAKPADVIKIGAGHLFAQYESNDIAADREYKGQILEVSGSVEDISRDILDTIYVTLRTGEYELFSIQCYFADSFEDQAAELYPGQYLTIRGRCDGKFGNVMIKDCILVE